LGFLFLGTEAPPCDDAADTNDDGIVDLSDPVGTLNFLFLGGSPPADSFPNCGDDPTTDDLDCVSFPSCAVRAVEGFTFLGFNAQGYPEYTHDQTGIVFVLLAGGEFEMGSPEDEPNRHPDNREGPVHTVTLSSFLIGKYEVTQAEYAQVIQGHATLNPNPSDFTGDDLPVEQVPWIQLEDADGFLARTGLSLRTEAQWEYACRGGTSTAFSWGDECNADGCDPCTPAVDHMWWCGNSGNTTHPVGEKLPNPFGLHDMRGNVWEFCEDWYQVDYYQELVDGGQPAIDPLCENPGSGRRVVRGGNFDNTTRACRSARRNSRHPAVRSAFVGFRLSWPSP